MPGTDRLQSREFVGCGAERRWWSRWRGHGAAGCAGRGAGADPGRPEFTPGAPGVGDPYFPLDGNGGYDVQHYLLEVAYDLGTDVLTGTATISARATQNLSSFNLDFAGLTIHSIEVNGRPADWTRDGDELTVTPRRGIHEHSRFRVVVTYDGVPETLPDASGFFHTDDGALALGQPHVADTWFPVNDHPIDKASYTIAITVPEGLEAISNGVLRNQRTRDGVTTWTWNAKEPMASYLAFMAIGEFDVRATARTGCGSGTRWTSTCSRAPRHAPATSSRCRRSRTCPTSG